MGKILHAPKVKLICAVLFSSDQPLDPVMTILKKHWGPIDEQSRIYEFHHTLYYRDEFGDALKKQFVSFEDLVDIDRMPDLKIESNAMEQGFAAGGRRTVNIDPGYIANAKLVMPTTKNLPHRVYIGKNIYADLQLIYKKPTFHPIAWTFADYKEPFLIEFFNAVRENYMTRMKSDPVPGE
jgi:hypothetical protein